MDDITKHYRFQRILQEAAAFRTLREIFDALPGRRDSKEPDNSSTSNKPAEESD